MLGSTEILLILAAALLLFGPDKLPGMANTLGKVMGDFKKAMREAETELSVPDIKESVEETINTTKVD